MSATNPDDLLLALQLFDGKLIQKRRKGSNYSSPEEGLAGTNKLAGEERLRSHAAIARLLLAGDPPEELLGRLAAAFAPDGDANAGHVKVSVSLRGPNIPDKEVRAAQMLLEIQANRVQQGMSLADAQAAVDEKHGYRGSAKPLWESARWRHLRARILEIMPLPEKGRR